VDLMVGLHRDSEATTVLVTHDLALADRAGRIIRLSSGRVVSDQPGEAGPVSHSVAETV